MPKRTDVAAAAPRVAPVPTAEAKAPQPQQVAKVEIDQSELLFTEAEMMDMPTDILVEILQNVYKVDPKSKQGVNSNKKVRTMILEAQASFTSKNKPLPVAVMAYKKKAAASPDKTTNPLPAAPVSPTGVVEMKQTRTVAFEVAATINTNNYENVKVSARVELPINPTPQDLAEAEETMRLARELCFTQINADIQLVRDTMTNAK